MVYATLGAPTAAFDRHQHFRIHGHDFAFTALDLSGHTSTVRDEALAALGVEVPIASAAHAALYAVSPAEPTS